MVNIDKLKLLYNKAIFLDDIRTKDIINTGLNKHDIEAFLKYNILKNENNSKNGGVKLGNR